MKIKKFAEKTLSETFLGTILLYLYRKDKINEWQAIKFYNELSKKIGKDGINLQDVFEHCKVQPDEDFAIVVHKDGKYSPVATAFIVRENDKLLLPLLPNEGYTGILAHVHDEGIQVITKTYLHGYVIPVE